MDDNKNDIGAGQIFNSYEQFFEIFKTFCDENYQPLVITDNNYKRQVTILCLHGFMVTTGLQKVQVNELYYTTIIYNVMCIYVQRVYPVYLIK